MMRIKYTVRAILIFCIITFIAACQAPSKQTEVNAPQNSQAASAPGFLEGVKLSAEQLNKIKQIQTRDRSKIDAILTPEQREQLQKAIGNGPWKRGVLRSLDISGEQRDKIREIIQSQRQEITNILTEEQKQKLKN